MSPEKTPETKCHFSSLILEPIRKEEGREPTDKTVTEGGLFHLIVLVSSLLSNKHFVQELTCLPRREGITDITGLIY